MSQIIKYFHTNHLYAVLSEKYLFLKQQCLGAVINRHILKYQG